MSMELNKIDPALFDRFVDGELDEFAQRALLARLDAEPDGWRRLALAFAEAQLWRGELRTAVVKLEIAKPDAEKSAATKSTEVKPIESTPTPVVRGWWSTMRAVNWTAVAAGMLLAAWLGVGIGKNWRGTLSGGPVDLAKTPVSPRTPDIASRGSAGLPLSSPQATTVTLVDSDGTPIQLPVYDAANVDPRLIGQQPPAVSPEMIRSLRVSGHNVKKRQQMWPIDLGDGRRIVVPVEQVEVRYVGNEAFQ